MDWFKFYANEITRNGDGKVKELSPGKVLVTLFVLDAPRFEPSIGMTKEEFTEMCHEFYTDSDFDMNGFRQRFVAEFARGLYEDGYTATHKPSEIPTFEEPEYDPDAPVDFSEFGIDL